jgi:hypothetical protein
MTAVELNPPQRHFKCPSCPAHDVTDGIDGVELGGGAARMHACPGNGHLTIPLVEVASADHAPEARHVPQMGEVDGLPVITSIGTEHATGRIDRTVTL